MKLKHTQAKKANRLCIRMENATSAPVWLRRLRGMYGADFRAFDQKHPWLETFVQGVKKRMDEKQEKQPAVR